jgi:hypothetical protein
MSVLRNGICGATLTPTGTPASASARMVRSRRQGAAARGSRRRESCASSVVTVTYTAARPARGHGGDEVQVALHAAALGDQRKRVAGLLQHLDDCAGQAQLALHRLVAVGGRAQVQPVRPVAGCRQFAPQHLGQVALGDDLGLEVQPRRQVQVAVRGPRVAVAAAMFAAAVRVDGEVEVDVGRVVAGDGGPSRLRRSPEWAPGTVLRPRPHPATASRRRRLHGCPAKSGAPAEWPCLGL